MAATSIWRWVLLRAAHLPGSWLLGIAFVGLVPLLQGLAPLTSHTEPDVPSILSWLSLAAWLGATLGLVLLSEGASFLRQVPGHTRWTGELGALFLSAVSMQLPILGGALLAGAQSIDLLAELPGILALDLHLAGMALLLLLVALPGALRALLFASVIWIVPALLAHSGAPSRAFASLANPGAAGLALSSLAPTLAECLTGYLLRTRDGASAAHVLAP